MHESPLPKPQRIITADNENGESCFSTTEPVSLPAAQDLGTAKMCLAYTCEPRPTQKMLQDSRDLQLHSQVALAGETPLVRSDDGTNVWIIDTPPASKSPIHRTDSIDYVIMITGTIELSMTDGDTRTVRPGDIVVQRGTVHVWSNPSPTEWTRFIAAMVGTDGRV